MKDPEPDSCFKPNYELLPPDISRDIGHFNIFDIEEMVAKHRGKLYVPFNNRVFYKIALKDGHNIIQFPDQQLKVKSNSLLFSTPKYPSNWLPQSASQKGHVCVFTEEFLVKNKSGFIIDEFPVFTTGTHPVFELSSRETKKVNELFLQIHEEIGSQYALKYDLIRNLVMEIIHFAQKKMDSTDLYLSKDASTRLVGMFIELLERQFPIESPIQCLTMVSARDYASQLAVHVNHLNMVVKEKTGKTTTDFINDRIVNEAKLLLQHSNWQISEISYCLGFKELAHFSNFFKKHTSFSPSVFKKL